jgi:hypothetical protein
MSKRGSDFSKGFRAMMFTLNPNLYYTPTGLSPNLFSEGKSSSTCNIMWIKYLPLFAKSSDGNILQVDANL